MKSLRKKESFDIKEVEGKYTKYHIWKYIPLEHIPNEEHIGKRVCIAGYFKTDKFFLKKVHYSGEKYWPQDGYTVVDNTGGKRSFLKEEVRLHPIEYMVKRKKKKIILKRKIRLDDIKKNLNEIKKFKNKIKRRKLKKKK